MSFCSFINGGFSGTSRCCCCDTNEAESLKTKNEKEGEIDMKIEKNGTLYLNLILGSIGIILIALGIFEFLVIVESTMSAYILTLLGFITIVHYICI